EITQHCLKQRQSLLPRLGQKGLSAESLAEGGYAVCPARYVSDVVGVLLDYALLAAHIAAPPAHVLGGLIDLFFPCHVEQPLHPMFCEYQVNGFQERCFVSDLPFPPPSGGRQRRQFCLCMAQTCF